MGSRVTALCTVLVVFGIAAGAGAARKPRPVPKLPSPGDGQTLRAAIRDLSATFGRRYPGADKLLAKLDDIERRMAALPSADSPTGAGLREELLALQRRALLANPLVADRPILFVTRQQYRGDHHNTATMFQTGEINSGKFAGGGAIKVWRASTGKADVLLKIPTGVARDPEVSFDGRRVLFSMRRDTADDYHIYELTLREDDNAEGEPLAASPVEPRQITRGGGVSDIDPLYLSDGRIAFTSTREPKYCMCNRHIMGNLFRVGADGSGMEQIGKSTLHEGHGSLTPDGRILYDRWEYVDRNFGDAQGVWVCNPDGTNHAIFYGNNTASPGAMLDNRIIPGTGGCIFVSTYSSCHDRPWGAIALVDRSRGYDSPAGEIRTWPASAMGLVARGNYDMFKRVFPKYEDPYPLADGEANLGSGKYFLCSRQTGKGEQMGIYLLDVFGNELLLHAEPDAKLGCFDPMPLGPRPSPDVVPDRRDLSRTTGRVYVQDVYIGTGMDRVPRGSVKSLRVVESPEKRFWTHTAWSGSGTQAPGMAWNDFNNKRIIGTVPVEPDGSAYFTVPADRFVYFQLLDANGMMIQSMRSGTILRPGETLGCVGCHEDRQSSAEVAPAIAAMSRPPKKLKPFYGPARLYNYVDEVQPVFDRHCTKCHDYGGKGAQKVTLAGDLGLIFNASYFDLRSKKLVVVPGAGPANILAPMSWGSRRSKLVETLGKGHHDVKLSKEDFDRIVTWIDINAPYYPSYASAYPGNQYGRSPLTNAQAAELAKLTGVNLRSQGSAAAVSFTRPEKSPCLALLNKSDPRYAKALAIIQAGRDQLAKQPRAEMPGFKLIGIEAKREAKNQALRAELAEHRRRIVGSEK